SVVEGSNSQSLANRQRNAKFGIRDEKLAAPLRSLNLAASSWIVGIATHGNGVLRASAVEWKSAQRTAAPGEKQLADWNVTTGKGLGDPDAHTICPYNARANILVVSGLSTQTREIHTRSQTLQVDIEVHRLIQPL